MKRVAMMSDVIFSARLDRDGFKNLCVIIFSLEEAMDYPLVDSVKSGHRLWDSVVRGGGDIMLPRLIRVGDLEIGSRRAYITDSLLRNGLYSGRICVRLTNRAWRLVPTDAMAIGPVDSVCDISIRMYGLVFVSALPSPAPHGATVQSYFTAVAARHRSACMDAWAALSEWLQSADEPPRMAV